MKFIREENTIISLENVKRVDPSYDKKQRTERGQKKYSTSIIITYLDDETEHLESPEYIDVDDCEKWITKTVDTIASILD